MCFFNKQKHVSWHLLNLSICCMMNSYMWSDLLFSYIKKIKKHFTFICGDISEGTFSLHICWYSGKCLLSLPYSQLLNQYGANRKIKCSPHPHDTLWDNSCDCVWLLSFASLSVPCIYWLKGLAVFFIQAHRGFLSGGVFILLTSSGGIGKDAFQTFESSSLGWIKEDLTKV